MINEEKLEPIVIDFAEIRNSELNESFLAAFGNWVKLITKRMFDNPGISVPSGGVSVRGTPTEVKSFARALGNEKKYIEVAKRHGLDDPRTISNKAKLKKAINAFERETGIKWPFE
tara:strand:+ start:9170 stop:9517 length:348 start_codon:yes stop_codon:yes gene_type:complete